MLPAGQGDRREGMLEYRSLPAPGHGDRGLARAASHDCLERRSSKAPGQAADGPVMSQPRPGHSQQQVGPPASTRPNPSLSSPPCSWPAPSADQAAMAI